jgi:hypothetical protein
MKLQKQLLITLALVALFGANGCRRNSAPSEPTAAAPADESARQHPDGGVATAIETRFFRGSIGNSQGMQMKLMREGDKLTGSYSYQKVGKKIDLRGNVDQGGNVSLEEFDPAGKQTGIFKGVWKLDQDGAVEISGDWTNPSGEKKTKFSLSQEPIEFNNGVEIVSRQIKENNKKLRYEIKIDYPQLTGSTDPNFEKFNQTVRSLMNRKAGDFKKEMLPEPEAESRPEDERPANEPDPESVGSDIDIGYSIALAKDDLISVEFTVSSYSAGAAHPNSFTEVVNFDLKNGKQLKLADLFLPGSKYLQTLATTCIQALTKQAQEEGPDGMLDEAWIQRGAAPELTNYDNWTISRKGLGITFDPYQVAAYAAGPQHVTAPYSALQGIIKPDGPVGQFVK